jgi:hypothetical protein
VIATAATDLIPDVPFIEKYSTVTKSSIIPKAMIIDAAKKTQPKYTKARLNLKLLPINRATYIS